MEALQISTHCTGHNNVVVSEGNHTAMHIKEERYDRHLLKWICQNVGMRVRVGTIRMLGDCVQVKIRMLSKRTLLTLWMWNGCAVREVTARELILSESVEMDGRGSLVGLATTVAQSDSTSGEMVGGGRHRERRLVVFQHFLQRMDEARITQFQWEMDMNHQRCGLRSPELFIYPLWWHKE